MPVCPQCNIKSKRKIDDCCPVCGIKVMTYKGRWFKSSPTVSILEHFEHLVSDTLSVGRESFPVNFSIPRNGTQYKRDLVVAGQMLEKADWDVLLVKEAIDLIFSDRRFSWKSPNSLMNLSRDYNITLSIARANKLAREKTKEQEQNAIQNVLDKRKDIWR